MYFSFVAFVLHALLISCWVLSRSYLIDSTQCGASYCLTLRLLMSYIYMEHLFLMFLDHTQRRSTVGRTLLDE